jgi:hypothetical protein
MEIVSREDVGRVLSLFQRSAEGNATLSDEFIQLWSALHIKRATGADVGRVFGPVSRLAGEFETLLTILERSNWQKTAASQGHLDQTAWLFFASLDVEHFFLSLRSLFDYAGEVCESAASKPGQLPTSFHALFNLCQANNRRAETLLGAEIASAIRDCRWFPAIRATRDGIVHYGALTLALPGFDTVSFKVEAGPRSAKAPPELMTNESLADFDLFMAWVLGNVRLLMNRLANCLFHRIELSERFAASSAKRGHTVLCAYLDRLAERLPPAPIETALARP